MFCFPGNHQIDIAATGRYINIAFSQHRLVLLGQQPQQCYPNATNIVTQSGSLIFANGIRKNSVGAPKTSSDTHELAFEKHFTSAGTAAIESFTSGSNRASAISGKRSSDFNTASLQSGNGNNQPETAHAMLLVHSQQVSKNAMGKRLMISNKLS